ncbi:hypothetical protein, partial [Legionella sp.]|uniref:hypothetical protein n=1 Tax=Legionella sp. TaxID=459 RepID=UPI00257A4773
RFSKTLDLARNIIQKKVTIPQGQGPTDTFYSPAKNDPFLDSLYQSPSLVVLNKTIRIQTQIDQFQ